MRSVVFRIFHIDPNQRRPVFQEVTRVQFSS